MKYRPVKQRRRLRPRWDHLLFSLLFSLSLSLSFPLCRDGIYPSSLLSPSRCPACSQSSAALTSSPLIPLPSTHSPLLHSPIFPFHRPTNVPRGGPRSSFPALTISICRAEGRGAELVRRASLFLFFLYFLLLVILLLCFSCSCLEVRNQEGWYPSWRGGGARRGSAVNRRRGREFRQLVSTW